MKKIFCKRLAHIIALSVCVMMLGVFMSAFTACSFGGEKDILVIAREDGSGTRDAFDSLVVKDGVSLKNSEMTGMVEMLSKTGDVITKVSSVESSIGYISLGSINESVRSVKIGGVEAKAENVISGEYELWRPFVIMTNKTFTDAGTLTPAAKDFLSYLKSDSAQEICGESYVSVSTSAQYSIPTEALSGEVVLRGSTSVEPLMGVLISDYQQIGGEKVKNIEFNMQCQGSSQGISAVKADVNGNVIGMSSAAIKSADESALAHFDVALDSIAIIVNKANLLEDISIGQLYDIYTGEIKKFSHLNA